MGTFSQEQITLLTDYDTASSYSIAYHTIYANIRFTWDKEQKKQHSILLAVPAPYPGQATAVANIAIAAAQDGITTLLVDADLRNPSLQQRFGVEPGPGLGELLASQTITSQTISPYLKQTFIPNLRLLSAGQSLPQPQEINRLFAASFENVLHGIEELQKEANSLVVFNCPAIQVGLEASRVGALVEQTFIGIAIGHTTRKQARLAQEQLQRAHAKLTGIILLDA